MKKSIALSLAVVAAFSALSTASAMDELSYNAASPALVQERQANYLDALAKRYSHMYNNARHNRNYYNSYTQKARVRQLKKDNNITGIFYAIVYGIKLTSIFLPVVNYFCLLCSN